MLPFSSFIMSWNYIMLRSSRICFPKLCSHFKPTEAKLFHGLLHFPICDSDFTFNSDQQQFISFWSELVSHPPMLQSQSSSMSTWFNWKVSQPCYSYAYILLFKEVEIFTQPESDYHRFFYSSILKKSLKNNPCSSTVRILSRYDERLFIYLI